MLDLRDRLLLDAAGGPDPDGAPTRIARFADACAEHGGVDACVPDEEALRLLTALAAQSPYLMAPLIRDPRRLAELARDPWLAREKDADTMRRELAAETGELASRLRRLRNREYLRLGARELGWGPAVAVARELAHLADVCLDAALAEILADLTARHGEPRTSDGRRCRFVVFGMGKLGGEELNFSSDIDLLYLYETDQGGAGPLTLHEFFSRVGERLTRVIGDVTDEGFCFRVDLRLRPEGTRGPLTNSVGAAERYYEAFGRPWERQAWIKARAVAGDLDLGDEALAILQPFVWPRSLGLSAITAVQELLARLRSERATGHDVKLGPGGIREVEFFAQSLQLVHGGRNPSLRERGTLRALDRLRFAGIVSAREHERLGDAYRFLRRVEHRLQLVEGRQTHALPEDPLQVELLARRLGFADRDAFTRSLEDTRRAVAAIFATLGAPAAAAPSNVARLLDAAATREAVVAALTALGFRAPDAAADELELLRRKPHSPFSPSADEARAQLALALLEEAAASPDPDLALRRLVDLAARGRQAEGVWRLVGEHAPLLRVMVTLLGTSEFLGKTFVAHPELIEPLLATAQAQRIRTRDEIDALVMRAQDSLDSDDEEARLNALRRVKNEELLRLGLFDVAGELTVDEVAQQVSDLAESILEAALALVAPSTFRKWGTPAASLAVLGLGKLGGRELTYASDLDVVFIYSDEGNATGGRGSTNFEVMSRLAQRLIHALSAHLEEGRLFEIDTRLRPSGQKGALVSSLAGFRAYHAREAALWERQALIKARTVAGDRALGHEIERLAQAIVYGAPVNTVNAGAPSHVNSVHMAQEIGRLRARMERELAQETAHKFNIKTGRGGLVDVEFLVQYLQLCHGPSEPSLRQRATGAALAGLAARRILPPDEAEALAQSYAFLRRLENRLRIVHDRSMQEVTDRADELTKLARRLEYPGADAGARLLADYRAHTERIRGIYSRYLPAP